MLSSASGQLAGKSLINRVQSIGTSSSPWGMPILFFNSFTNFLSCSSITHCTFGYIVIGSVKCVFQIKNNKTLKSLCVFHPHKTATKKALNGVSKIIGYYFCVIFWSKAELFQGKELIGLQMCKQLCYHNNFKYP